MPRNAGVMRTWSVRNALSSASLSRAPEIGEMDSISLGGNASDKLFVNRNRWATVLPLTPARAYHSSSIRTA